VTDINKWPWNNEVSDALDGIHGGLEKVKCALKVMCSYSLRYWIHIEICAYIFLNASPIMSVLGATTLKGKKLRYFLVP
jgi:hypothetical protein